MLVCAFVLRFNRCLIDPFYSFQPWRVSNQEYVQEAYSSNGYQPRYDPAGNPQSKEGDGKFVSSQVLSSNQHQVRKVVTFFKYYF